MRTLKKFLIVALLLSSGCSGYGLHFSVKDFDAGFGHQGYRKIGVEAKACRVGDRMYECETL